MDPNANPKWVQAEGVTLCRLLYPLCEQFGCFPALTGGLLYKDGPRKDCDILFYRKRDVPVVDVEGLFKAAEAVGLKYVRGGGWCVKALWMGKSVDCFFPESPGDQAHTSESAHTIATELAASLLANSLESEIA